MRQRWRDYGLGGPKFLRQCGKVMAKGLRQPGFGAKDHRCLESRLGEAGMKLAAPWLRPRAGDADARSLPAFADALRSAPGTGNRWRTFRATAVIGISKKSRKAWKISASDMRPVGCGAWCGPDQFGAVAGQHAQLHERGGQ
jgi:hypothetical protein